ncbi:MAG: ABC transporter permease [Caldilineaceae bacterium]|nr:ABC transporter permease [Caldilineaceae bacterium]MCB0143870.1 ABC transporter permease [Caldilineaceae bacterium]
MNNASSKQLLERDRGFWASLRGFMRTSRMGTISAIFLLVLIFVALLANFVAPYHPLEADFRAMRHPPNLSHVLGTDNLGRDVLSRLIHGARISLFVALVSTVLSKIVGLAWGILTGYLGRSFDLISQRVIDVLLAFPGIILAMLLLSALGGGLGTVITAITLLGVAGTVRVIRSVVLSVKEMTYVEAARAVGVSDARIMARHVAPQCIAPLLVLFSASLGGAIFAEAALSFLGLGIPQPAPSWGNMLGGILANQFRPEWWLVIFPGVAITITVLAFNLVGDALRDYLDPKIGERLP